MKKIYLLLTTIFCIAFLTSCEEEEEVFESLTTFNDSEGIYFFAEWKVGDHTITESINMEYLEFYLYHEDDYNDFAEGFEDYVSWSYAENQLSLTDRLKDGLYTLKIGCDYDMSEKTTFTVW